MKTYFNKVAKGAYAKGVEDTELKLLSISGVSNLLFCPYCGNKRELIVETDINSGRTCKSKLCWKTIDINTLK